MRFLWFLALVPAVAFVVLSSIAASAFVPWWSVAFGALFWVQILRWRRLRASGEVSEGSGALFSPFRGGGY